ncbi:MAG: hypothetical protein KAH21_06670, partial [Spirochaetaceae bacterium]|nr:hypothetical protein [Spirochaetaceae bacterium]
SELASSELVHSDGIVPRLSPPVRPLIRVRAGKVRVLQRGRWEDWLLLKTHYDKPRLRNLSSQLKLDPKSAHFLKRYYSL